jgi:hypothetical protein
MGGHTIRTAADRPHCVLSPWKLFAADRTYATPGPIARRTTARFQAALTALVFVVSSLAGLVHEATTRHVQCAEHGEQMHSDAVVVTASAPQARDLAPALQRQPATAIHGHEHCLMASATRESRIAPCPPAIAAADVAITQLALTALPTETARDVRLYLTAPKTSPPA